MSSLGAWLYTGAVAGVGAACAFLICAWTRVGGGRDEWRAGWSAGRASLTAELDVLAAAHPDLGLSEGLTMAAVGRLLDKENQ